MRKLVRPRSAVVHVRELWRQLLKNGTFTSEQNLAEQMLAFAETYTDRQPL